jgi:ABC-type multidrug transport system fused ATPase/permease subunit
MSILKQIIYYFSVYKKYIGKRLYIVFILSALSAALEGVGIAMLLPLIAAADVGVDRESIMESSGLNRLLQTMLDGLGIGSSVVGILLSIGFMFIFKGFVTFSANAYQAHLRAQLLEEMKIRLFERYSSMDYSYYSKRSTGHFVNVITMQATRMIGTFGNLKDYIAKLITTFTYVVIAFFLAWNFALMAVVGGGLLLLMFRGLNRYVHMLSRKTAQEQGHLNKFLVQTMQSFKYLVSTGQIGPLRNALFDSVKKLVSYDRKHGIADALTQSLTEPVSILFVLIVIVIQLLVLDAPLAPIFVSLMLFNRAMGGVMGAQNEWQRILAKIGSMELVEQELLKLDKLQEHSGAYAIGPLMKQITFGNVSYAYTRKSELVLRNIDLVIHANTTVAFVGESGSGKSTLVDMLTLLLKPNSGQLCIDGVNAGEVQLDSWREQIGYVSQETVVFDDTIANNICLWKDDYQRDPDAMQRIIFAAKQAHADRFIAALPDGYNTVVGDRGIRLSGGQRQRLFLSRELYKQPRLLILDEATSALDSESEQFIKESIDALRGRMTVVMIAHRLSTIKDVDTVYVLDKGSIVEQGKYHDLLERDGGIFARMVLSQSL